MIEISVSTLIGCIETINKLIEKPFKAFTAYKIARIAREIQRELESYNVAKEVLLKKYGELDKSNKPLVNKDGSYKIIKDKQEEFKEEFQKLSNQLIKLNIEPIQLEELEEERLTPQEINTIIDFIKK